MKQMGIWEAGGEGGLAEQRGLSDVSRIWGGVGVKGGAIRSPCPVLLCLLPSPAGGLRAQSHMGRRDSRTAVCFRCGLPPSKLIAQCKLLFQIHVALCLQTCKELRRQNSILPSILCGVKTIRGN